MSAPLKILILEDVPADAELVQFELRRADLSFSLRVVADEAAFLESLESFQPDVILADYRLPGYNGLQALAASKEKCPETPFIFVSGTMGEEVAIDTLKQGATDYVLKNRLVRLVPAVQRALAEARVQRERRLAEEALRHSEEDYLLLVKSLPAVVYKGYLDWRVDFFDDKIEELTGYPKADFDARKIRWSDLILPEDLEAVKSLFKQGLQTSRSYVREYRIRDRGGRSRWVQDRGQIISNDRGEVDHISGVLFDISERKHAEIRTARQRAVLDGMNRIFREALTCRTEEELGRTCLAVVEELTGSQFGFINEINKAGKLDCLAVSDPGWAACKMGLQQPPRNFHIRGLFGKVFLGEQSYIANSPASDPNRIGLPEGHPPLTAFLGVPLKHGGKTMGMIGLGNKAGGYDRADQEMVESLAAPIVEVFMRKRAERDLRDSEHKLRLLTSQLLTAQERERKRISMELHDELGQSLNVLKLQMRAIQRNLGQDPGKSREECEYLLPYVDEIIDNVRRLSRDLSPAILEDLGLMSALKYLFDGFSQHYDLKYSMVPEGLNDLFPGEAQIIIYRIFQELLTNISKHAHAGRVDIAIRREGGQITITVEDDGVGFEVAEALGRKAGDRGLGLAALDERARMLGGSLEIRSKIGEGTKVSLEISLEQRDDRLVGG